jgi:hypothetical protein
MLMRFTAERYKTMEWRNVPDDSAAFPPFRMKSEAALEILVLKLSLLSKATLKSFCDSKKVKASKCCLKHFQTRQGS